MSVFSVSLYTFVLGHRLIQRTLSLISFDTVVGSVLFLLFCYSGFELLNVILCFHVFKCVFSRRNCTILPAAALWCAAVFIIGTCKFGVVNKEPFN